MTEKQKQFNNKCPECKGRLNEVEPENEVLLWCEDCDVCIDSDGGITN